MPSTHLPSSTPPSSWQPSPTQPGSTLPSRARRVATFGGALTLAGAALVAGAGTALAAPAGPAGPAVQSAHAVALSATEAGFVAATNADRAAAGLPALCVADDVTQVARRWSAVMLGNGGISHNPALTTDITGWSHVGENVGVGPSVDALEQAFMNSPHHRDNILDRDYTQVGIGTATSPGGTVYVTVDFRRPTNGGGCPAPVAPAPVPMVVAPVALPFTAPPVVAMPTPRQRLMTHHPVAYRATLRQSRANA